MNEYEEIRRVSAENLRALCINMNWYTRGTCSDYDHLLIDMAHSKDNLTTADIIEIAEDIAAHSNLDDVCPEDDIIASIAYEVASISTTFFRQVEEQEGSGRRMESNREVDHYEVLLTPRVPGGKTTTLRFDTEEEAVAFAREKRERFQVTVRVLENITGW